MDRRPKARCQTRYDGPTEREVAFTVGLDTVNKVVLTKNQDCRLVQQKTIDSILSNVSPTFAKLDVEGYEEEVLRGGQAFLGRSSLQAIQLETVTPHAMKMLSLHGFARAFYDQFRRFLSTEAVDIQSCNALFVKNVSFVNSRIGQSPKVRVLDFLIWPYRASGAIAGCVCPRPLGLEIHHVHT